MKLFNKLFYNKDLLKKSWHLKGVETDPTQQDNCDDYTLIDKAIDITIVKEKGNNPIILTLDVDKKEYNIVLYDEIISYINKIKEK